MNIFQSFSFRHWWITKTSIPPSWLGQEEQRVIEKNEPKVINTSDIQDISQDTRLNTKSYIRTEWDSLAYMAWIEGGA